MSSNYLFFLLIIRFQSSNSSILSQHLSLFTTFRLGNGRPSNNIFNLRVQMGVPNAGVPWLWTAPIKVRRQQTLTYRVLYM